MTKNDTKEELLNIVEKIEEEEFLKRLINISIAYLNKKKRSLS